MAPTEDRRPPGILLFVLIAAMAAGPVLNYGLSALSPQIIETYDITEGQYGLIITIVFLIAGLSATVLGALSDRMPVRLQLTLVFGLMAVAFLVSISSPTYAALLTAAVIAGPAQAVSNPVTNRIIASEVPLARRGMWMGLKQSGVQFGLLFCGLTVPIVGKALGWTGVGLMFAVICGVMLVIAWFVVTRMTQAPPPTPVPRPTAATEFDSAPSRRLPAAVWLLTVCSFLNAVGTQGVNAYASLFAVQTVDYPIELAGTMLAIMGVIGIVARVLWGRVTGRLGRPAVLIQLMSLGGILAMVCLIVVEHWHVTALLWTGITGHALFPLAANVVINSGVVALTPAGRVGIASGLVASGMYLGFALGPVLVGSGIDLTGDYTPGWSALAVCYLACIIVGMVLVRLRRSTDQS